MRRFVLAAPLLIVLAACGGHSASASSSSGEPPSVASLAAKLGCSGSPDPSPALFARESQDCTVNGEDVTLTTFNTPTSGSQYLKVAQSFGGVYVVGDGPYWIVDAQTQAVARAVQAKLGGKVK